MEGFRLAALNEAQEILEFYHSFIGTEGCTWTTDYPQMQHVLTDIEKDNLFLVKDEKGIVATISIDSDELVDHLPNWTVDNAKEAARLGVRADRQCMGIARQMLVCLMEELKRRGYDAIHFLVSPENPAAIASYETLDFDKCGQTELYDHHWLCYEKRI